MKCYEQFIPAHLMLSDYATQVTTYTRPPTLKVQLPLEDLHTSSRSASARRTQRFNYSLSLPKPIQEPSQSLTHNADVADSPSGIGLVSI